jgi:cobalt transporter subunit CbtA
MIARVLAVAIAAGLIAGLFASLIQSYKVFPLIQQAETYEVAAAEGDHQGAAAWAPSDGLERTAYSWLTNSLTGVAYGLLLVAGFLLCRRDIDWRKGVLWGLGGFAAFALAPAVVLPPEAPGAVAASVPLRQGLWALIAVATAGGLALVVFAKPWALRLLGLVLILAPLAISTPHGEGVGNVPPELSAQFVTASLGAAALFWVTLGGLSGHFYRRFLGQ